MVKFTFEEYKSFLEEIEELKRQSYSKFYPNSCIEINTDVKREVLNLIKDTDCMNKTIQFNHFMEHPEQLPDQYCKIILLRMHYALAVSDFFLKKMNSQGDDAEKEKELVYFVLYLKAVQAKDKYGITLKNLDYDSFLIRTQAFEGFKKIIEKHNNVRLGKKEGVEGYLELKIQEVIGSDNMCKFKNFTQRKDYILDYRWWTDPNITPLDHMVNDGVQGFTSLFSFTEDQDKNKNEQIHKDAESGLANENLAIINVISVIETNQSLICEAILSKPDLTQRALSLTKFDGFFKYCGVGSILGALAGLVVCFVCPGLIPAVIAKGVLMYGAVAGIAGVSGGTVGGLVWHCKKEFSELKQHFDSKNPEKIADIFKKETTAFFKEVNEETQQTQENNTNS